MQVDEGKKNLRPYKIYIQTVKIVSLQKCLQVSNFASTKCRDYPRYGLLKYSLPHIINLMLGRDMRKNEMNNPVYTNLPRHTMKQQREITTEMILKHNNQQPCVYFQTESKISTIKKQEINKKKKRKKSQLRIFQIHVSM